MAKSISEINDGAVEIKLTKPVKAFGEEITVLRLRRPIGKDYRSIPADTSIGAMLDFAAQLADVPPSTIDQLDGVDDIPELLAKVTGFLGKFLKIGPTS